MYLFICLFWFDLVWFGLVCFGLFWHIGIFFSMWDRWMWWDGMGWDGMVEWWGGWVSEWVGEGSEGREGKVPYRTYAWCELIYTPFFFLPLPLPYYRRQIIWYDVVCVVLYAKFKVFFKKKKKEKLKMGMGIGIVGNKMGKCDGENCDRIVGNIMM